MALPRRPNARLGLPSNPSPRSRTLSAPDPQAAVPPRPSSAAALHSGSSSPAAPQADRIRPQRSLTSLRGEPGTARAAGRARTDARPPVPPLPPLPPPTKPGTSTMSAYTRRNGSAASLASASSASSSYASPAASDESFTSVEDSAEPEKGPPALAPGFGSSLWSRVAAAAGNLTVNINRAWEANIGLSSGEVTPPGEESRLAKAIKAYHIEKARDPSDLPEWLFSERERGVRAAPRAAEPEAQPAAARAPAPPRADPRARAQRAVDEEHAASMSRAATKLRELRDQKAAKRTPTIRFADTPHPRHAPSTRTLAPPPPPVAPPPLPELPEPRLVTNVRPVASLKSVGKRPNAVGLPTSVRPRRPT